MKLVTICFLVLLSACSLISTNQWSAYKVKVEVQNESGQGVEGAVLKSSEIDTKKTDENGKTELQFQSAGLHVITITAENTVTKQIKIGLPQDDNKIIQVILNSNP